LINNAKKGTISLAADNARTKINKISLKDNAGMCGNIYLYLSVFFAVSGILLFSGNNHGIINRIIFAFLVIIETVLGLFYGISDYFTGNGIDESVIYHITFGLKGADFSGFTRLYILISAVCVFTFILLLYAFSRKTTEKNRKKAVYFGWAAYLTVIAALAINPAIRDLSEIF